MSTYIHYENLIIKKLIILGNKRLIQRRLKGDVSPPILSDFESVTHVSISEKVALNLVSARDDLPNVSYLTVESRSMKSSLQKADFNLFVIYWHINQFRKL